MRSRICALSLALAASCAAPAGPPDRHASPSSSGESEPVGPGPVWTSVVVREPIQEYAAPPLRPEDVTPVERALMDRIQREREASGRAPLTLDPNLVITARAHSKEMAEEGYFAHESPGPGPTTPVHRFLETLRASGQPIPSYVLVGENIYHNSLVLPGTGADMAHRAFLGSPSHRRTMLSASYAFMGVGAYESPEGGLWITEMFLRVTPWTSEDLDPAEEPPSTH